VFALGSEKIIFVVEIKASDYETEDNQLKEFNNKSLVDVISKIADNSSYAHLK
jgi:hypothetical protein